MDWADIITKEYENLKRQKEEEIKQFWNINKASVCSQSGVTRCAVWNKNNKWLQLKTGKAIQTYFHGENQQTHSIVNPFMLPTASPPPKMTMWLPIPQNFVSKDSEELQSIPYLGDTIDDSFVNDLISSYNGNISVDKNDSIDNEMFVNLARKLIPYRKSRTPIMMSQLASQVEEIRDTIDQKIDEELPDAIIFQQISSYFNGHYTAEK